MVDGPGLALGPSEARQKKSRRADRLRLRHLFIFEPKNGSRLHWHRLPPCGDKATGKMPVPPIWRAERCLLFLAISASYVLPTPVNCHF